MFDYPQIATLGGPDIKEHVACVMEGGEVYDIFYYGTWEREGDSYIWERRRNPDEVGESCFVPMSSIEDMVLDITEWRYEPIDMGRVEEIAAEMRESLGVGQTRH
jgi:hypothetical protein